MTDRGTVVDGRSVTIPDTPERIVTLGDQWTDVVLSFGETPVGYYDYSKSATGEMQPWYGEKLADATFVDPTKGDDATTIAKLNPDLIFAPGFASDSPEFQQISKLAPTVNAISDHSSIRLFSSGVPVIAILTSASRRRAH